MTPSIEDAGSFDDLLNTPPTAEEKKSVADLKDSGKPAETPEQARIRELEAKIEALAAVAAAAPPAEVVKTPEQKEAEHRQAVTANAAALSAREAFEDNIDDADTITIHILESGFTFADRVWNFGQNVQIKRGGKAYQDTVDRDGNSWLDDLSVAAQRRRFRKIVVGEGLYDGPEFNDAIAAADKGRGNKAPVITIK